MAPQRLLSDLLQAGVAPGFVSGSALPFEAREIEKALLVLSARGGPSFETACRLPVWRVLRLLKTLIELKGHHD